MRVFLPVILVAMIAGIVPIHAQSQVLAIMERLKEERSVELLPLWTKEVRRFKTTSALLRVWHQHLAEIERLSLVYENAIVLSSRYPDLAGDLKAIGRWCKDVGDHNTKPDWVGSRIEWVAWRFATLQATNDACQLFAPTTKR